MTGMRGAAALTGALVLLAGCSSIVDRRGYMIDVTLVLAIQPGIDNRTSVEATLGRPSFASQFGPPTWYYVSNVTASTECPVMRGLVKGFCSVMLDT